MARAPSFTIPHQQQHPLRVKIRLGNRQAEAKLLRFSPVTMTMAALVRLMAAKLGVDDGSSSYTCKVYLDGEALVEEVTEIDDQDDLVLVVVISVPRDTTAAVERRRTTTTARTTTSRRGRGIGHDDTGGSTDKRDGDETAGGVTAGADEEVEEADAKSAPKAKRETTYTRTGRCRRGRGSGQDDTGGQTEKVDGDDKTRGVIGAGEKARGSSGANKEETKQAIKTETAAVAVVEPSQFKGRRVAAYFDVARSKRKKLYFGSVADLAASSSTWKIEYDDGDVFYVDRAELVAGCQRQTSINTWIINLAKGPERADVRETKKSPVGGLLLNAQTERGLEKRNDTGTTF